MAISERLNSSRGRLLGLLAARNKRREAEYQQRMVELESQRMQLEQQQKQAESNEAKGWLDEAAQLGGLGATLGSVVPGVGTAIGGAVGLGAGALLGIGKGVKHGMQNEDESFLGALGDTVGSGTFHSDLGGVVRGGAMAAGAFGGGGAAGKMAAMAPTTMGTLQDVARSTDGLSPQMQQATGYGPSGSPSMGPREEALYGPPRTEPAYLEPDAMTGADEQIPEYVGKKYAPKK